MKKLWYGMILALIAVTLMLPVQAAGEESKIERTTISGMTILLQKSNSELVEIALLLKSGSGLDPVDKKGTAFIMNQFVELLLQNGNDKIGNAAISTYPDYTMLRIRTAKDYVDETLAAIKFLLTYPLYDFDFITDYKGLLATDLKAVSAQYKSYWDLNQEFYGKDHPYNDRMDAEIIPKISGSDVYKWYRQTYQPGNAVLSISGGVNKNIGDIEKFFANMRTESVDRRLLINPVAPPATRQFNRDDPNGRVASVAIGFAAPRLQDPEFPAFRVISYYLEEYMHYFEELRVKEALFYTGFVYYNYLEKPKAPGIMFLTMTDPKQLGAVETGTLAVTRDLVDNGMKAEEIAKVIKAIKAELESRKKDGRGLAARNLYSFYLESQLVYDDKLMPKLEQITPEDIKKAAAKYFKNYIRVAYVPEKMAEDF